MRRAYEILILNSRLQVKELTLGTSAGDGSRFKVNYDYGELMTNGVDVDETKNAGNIAKQTVTFSGLANPFVQTYRYDFLDRITEAIEKVNGTQAWKQTFGNDRYGNRTSFYQKVGNDVLPINNLTLPTLNTNNSNRFADAQGYSYDKNGNITNDPVNGNRTFTFNGDNKQVEVRDSGGVVIGKYFYDGNGRRVKKETNLETTVFVYNGMGNLIAEYSSAAPPPAPTINYTMTDQLGSPRVITNAAGQVVSRRDFMPFGEELFPDGTYRKTSDKYQTSGQDAVRKRFTGYEKDIETGLDFAEARYYNNPHGRFTAVDPLFASGKSANPQTFNRYVYVMNNPIAFSDPSVLLAGSHSGAVYYKVTSSGAWAFSDRGGKGYDTRYTGPSRGIVGVDGYQYRVRSNGWTQGSKVMNSDTPAVVASPSQGISTSVTNPTHDNKVGDLVNAVNNAPQFQVAEAIHKVASPDGVTVSGQLPFVPGVGASLTLTSDLDVVWAPTITGELSPPMRGGASASFTWITDTDGTSRRKQRTDYFQGDSVSATACGRLCVGGTVVPSANGNRIGVTAGVATNRGVSSSFGNGRYVTNLFGLGPPDEQER